jgi:N-acetylglucosamine-6-sulfatase
VLSNRWTPDLRPNTSTVATYLNAGGYITGFVGKAHMGGDPRRWDFKECPMWLPGNASPHDDPTLMVNGEREQLAGEITEIFTDAALQFVEKHKQDRWFLWFATTAPHLPYISDPRHCYDPLHIKPPPGWPTTQALEWPERWADFYSTVSMLDEQVGRLLQELDELGLDQNTLVFMTSDNGYMFGSHGQFGKAVWFEESARMPALVRWPAKIKPGTKTASPLDSVDVLPTLLDVAGVGKELPKLYQGKSMMPALTGGKPPRRVAYSEVNSSHLAGGYWQMARDERWKYVRFKSGEEYLYDLKEDTWELKNLVGVPERTEVLREMREKLTAWLKATTLQTATTSSSATSVTPPAVSRP